jgi:hypothetical protein
MSACCKARGCCSSSQRGPSDCILRPLLPYLFRVWMSLTLRRPQCLLPFQQWFLCKNGNNIRKGLIFSTQLATIGLANTPWGHHAQAKGGKALFDCFRPPLVLFPLSTLPVRCCCTGLPGEWWTGHLTLEKRNVTKGATSFEPRRITDCSCALLLPRLTMCCPHSCHRNRPCCHAISNVMSATGHSCRKCRRGSIGTLYGAPGTVHAH